MHDNSVENNKPTTADRPSGWFWVSLIVIALFLTTGLVIALFLRLNHRSAGDPLVTVETLLSTASPSQSTTALPSETTCPESGSASLVERSGSVAQRPEPYTHTTWLVRSLDGITMTIDQKLLEHASVPEIVRAADGSVLVFAVDFSEAFGNGQERLVVMRSDDEGKQWTLPQPICLVGKTTTGAAVDPSVVVLPDGRFRLYYFGFGPPASSTDGPTGGATKPDPSIGHTFYSAISDDGISFTAEAGVRFQGQNITDPEVVQLPNGTWLMYISNGQETLIATSPDGLTFTDTRTTLAGGGVPGAVVLPDGTVRWYGCGQGGLVTATAADGVTFGDRQSVRLSPQPTDPIVCDPAVAQLPDGAMIGVIKTAPAQAPPPQD
ncbi:exo-alpha-sialidase [Candidatus Berkelbacteria bacterium]|nr:exo-alpha-sialidase [Candidatus Berkelbacteria bacterium]